MNWKSAARAALGGALMMGMTAGPALAQGHGQHAQQAGGEHPTLPEGWQMRPDRAGQHAGLSFEVMAPGWHITTGPSTILWDETREADGDYRVTSEIFLFDPGERREAFGIFIGGDDLDQDDQEYTYFLLRRDGRYLIKRRAGAETSLVRDWTEHPAIVSWEGRGEGATAKNVLAIEVRGDEVAFFVNDQEVARVPRADVDTDGIVGLRVNHGLNLHVTSLDVTPLS